MDKLRLNSPLVSIIIVTYNSSEFVLETLESAKAQTYKNIELIITDDSSNDNTIEVCNNWLGENTGRFASTKLLTSDKNTGIVPNCNRGLNYANGTWLKFIAGDDILIDTSIADFLSYCNKRDDCKLIFGRILYMKNYISKPKPLEKIAISPLHMQQKLVYLGSGLPAPAAFINRDLLISLGGFDERFLFVEDLPLWIKVVNNNIQIHFIDNFVVKYRIHDNNICMNNGNSRFYNLLFYDDNEKIILKELIPYYFRKVYLGRLLHSLNYIFISRLIILFGNKNNLFSKTLNIFIIKNTVMRLLNKLRNNKSSSIIG